MTRVALQGFLSFLDDLDKKDFRNDKVDAYLSTHQVGLNDFTPYIFFREDTYGRNLVKRTEFYELLVLTWLPKQRTPIHDHGGQRCWMIVHSGSLSFKNYAPVSSEVALIPNGPPEIRKVGESIYIDDEMGIHSIVNTHPRIPAVSVHLYAGPVPECQIYNEEAGRFEWTELKYFTQIGELPKAPTYL